MMEQFDNWQKWDEILKYGIKIEYEIVNVMYKLISNDMKMISDNDYSKSYDKSNHNKWRMW